MVIIDDVVGGGHSAVSIVVCVCVIARAWSTNRVQGRGEKSNFNKKFTSPPRSANGVCTICHTYTEHYARPSPPQPARGYSATVVSPSRSTAAAATIMAQGITYSIFISRCLPLPHRHRTPRLGPRLTPSSLTTDVYTMDIL